MRPREAVAQVVSSIALVYDETGVRGVNRWWEV